MFSRVRLKQKWTASRWTRLGVQLLFLTITAVAILRHRIAESQGLSGPQNTAPSVDSLSPFGGLETLWKWATTGQFLNHVHISDLILFGAAALLVLLLGSAFCGWICPFGTLFEWLYRLRVKLLPWKFAVPEKLDRILRYGRYVVLALALFATYSAGELIFGEYCPWRAAWQLGSDEIAIGGAIVLGLVVAAGLLVERAWCRYACPLGAVLGLANKVAPVKLRRTETACSACGLCNRKCPLDLKIDDKTVVTDTTCNRCLECVESCPKPEALQVKAGRRPVRSWLFGLGAAAIFGGVILLSQAFGLWQSSASAEPPAADAATGIVSTEEIKGWRTLQEITEIWKVPQADLYAQLGLDPATVPPSTQIKALEGRVAPDEETLSRAYVKDVVDRWLADGNGR
ncbi:MAG TPA: 4Fe-4S binding protein [Symbiobacteriaceae bacterium]|nr:4Fe-4S binding protein [Symbiobacteriaceae bacterium]